MKFKFIVFCLYRISIGFYKNAPINNSFIEAISEFNSRFVRASIIAFFHLHITLYHLLV